MASKSFKVEGEVKDALSTLGAMAGLEVYVPIKEGGQIALAFKNAAPYFLELNGQVYDLCEKCNSYCKVEDTVQPQLCRWCADKE